MGCDHLGWPHQLRKRFRIVVFDWDGTAVEDRNRLAQSLAQRMESLLRAGVILCAVTGAHLEHLLRACLSFIPGDARQNLYVFTNHGSEVWSFSVDGQPVLLERYSATPQENLELDHVVKNTEELLSQRGLEAEVISDRLNRRKIDLIPEPRWRDPKKFEFPELSQAVRERLRKSGLNDGIPEVIRFAEDEAKRVGLPRAKIASDQKHIEIGLTDKGDSMRWVDENIRKPRGISLEDLVVFGDEFGQAGGVRGSDQCMQLPALEDAVLCSVGVEPGGMPDGVIVLGGGPSRFQRFLQYQYEVGKSGITVYDGLGFSTPNPSWLLEQEGFDPSREHEMESLFAVSNSYLGVRASAGIPIASSQMELYLAGVYGKKAEQFPYSEKDMSASEDRKGNYSEIVPFPSPYRMRVRVNGVELSTESPRMVGYERILDLKKGLVFEDYSFSTSQNALITLRLLRGASQTDPHLLFQELRVHSEDESVQLEIDCSPEVSDFSLRYPHLRLVSQSVAANGMEKCVYDTGPSQFVAAFVGRRWVNGEECPETQVKITANPGETYVIRSCTSVFSNRDQADALAGAVTHSMEQTWDGIEQKVKEHASVWKGFWEKADLQLIETPSVKQSTRFCQYHLRSAAPVWEGVSVGARGLTGRSYEGHVFWDTEVFMFPFFLRHRPDAARNILLYRYDTLDGARARALAQGCRGASYAWESSVDGRDVTPTVILLLEEQKRVPIFTGSQQIHVTADVAYAVSQYWRETRDEEFMKSFGCEILFETARFWSSRVSLRGDRYRILGVVGPDEYHFNVDDNAYTNWMAHFNLKEALALLDWFKRQDSEGAEALLNRLNVSPAELSHWEDVMNRLALPQPNEQGVIEQFDGFFELSAEKFKKDAQLRSPVARLLKWDQVNQKKVLKQADVLMIFFMFPGEFSREIVEKNYSYYVPMTEHGSSLSPGVHAAIAADLGRMDEAWRYLDEGLSLDLQNLMKNTPLGIHLGCMGGSWQALVFHFLKQQRERRTAA